MSQQFPANPTVGSPSSSDLRSKEDHSTSESSETTQIPSQSETQSDAPVQNAPPIIDVVTSYQSGNYLPLLHCLNNNLISLDFFDPAGYHPLHTAVASNQIPMVVIFLDHYKVDVNLKAKNGQTPLMIAANYGYVQIIKMLCDRGADINEQEDTKFSPLLYTAKQGHLPAFCYLLSQNADIHVRDANGCTVVHWAAYKNNTFLLKVLHRLGLDMNILDFSGMTPLDRAVQSDGYKSTQFLLEVGDGTMPPNMEYPKVKEGDMKEILRRKYFKSFFEIKAEEAAEYFKSHTQKVVLGFYATMWLLAIIIFSHTVMFHGSSVISGLLFVVFGLYFMGYAYWYYTRSLSMRTRRVAKRGYDKLVASNDSPSEIELSGTNSGKELVRMASYGALNKLMPNDLSYDSQSTIPTFSTFLHELAHLVQTDNIKETERFNEDDYCPTCLVRKPPRSYHCTQEKTCVEGFCHYSYCLGKSVTLNDHYLYLIQILNQMVALCFFLFGVWGYYFERVHNVKVFAAEVGYILWNDFGLFYAGFYALAFACWVYNGVYMVLAIYEVMKNITHYEIFNSVECSYLYRTRIDREGKYVKRFYNPYDKGRWNNVKTYVKRIFHSESTDKFH